MCDTVVKVAQGRVLFAKNSDRDANEAQLLEWVPAAKHRAGEPLRCTWIEVPQVERTHAVLLSRPFWIWGAEIGANEHGLVIGNEAVFTRQPLARSGLTGMDLVRLALQRAASRVEAVQVIVALIEQHGQGGGCGHEDRSFGYHNSFLIADGSGATVLETADKLWASEEVSGTRAISNGLSIEGFARKHSRWLHTTVAEANRRRCLTETLAAEADDAKGMMAVLRSHGEPASVAPRYRWLNGALNAPCAHAGGLAVGSQTTASWVAEIGPGGVRHWVTATAAPCTGLFKPVEVTGPVDLGPAPTDRDEPASLWWRHEALHRQVMRDPDRLLPLYAEERDAVEARWLADPPEPSAAFAEADGLLQRWHGAVGAAAGSDRRPWVVRRYWRVRDRRAKLGLVS